MEHLETIFSTLDVDGDGKVSEAEFLAGFQTYFSAQQEPDYTSSFQPDPVDTQSPVRKDSNNSVSLLACSSSLEVFSSHSGEEDDSSEPSRRYSKKGGWKRKSCPTNFPLPDQEYDSRDVQNWHHKFETIDEDVHKLEESMKRYFKNFFLIFQKCLNF